MNKEANLKKNCISDMYTILGHVFSRNNESAKTAIDIWIEALSEMTVKEKAFLWFVVGEYCRVSGDASLAYNEIVHHSIAELLDVWEEIEPTILHLDVLGAVYGGLRSINYYLNNEAVAKVLKGLKWAAFERFISDGTLCHHSTEKCTEPVMLMACVPFGLFEPEDLVLVEAVKSMREEIEQVGAVIDKLLLAGYLLEKGETVNAVSLLDVSSSQLGRTMALEKAMVFWLKALMKARNINKIGSIAHQPFGHGNVYSPQPNERFPQNVCEGDRVTIGATVMSNEAVPMELCYMVDGCVQDSIAMEYRAGVYEGSFFAPKAGSEVSYFIKNAYDETERYRFIVNEVLIASRCIEATIRDDYATKYVALSVETLNSIAMPELFVQPLLNNKFYIGLSIDSISSKAASFKCIEETNFIRIEWEGAVLLIEYEPFRFRYYIRSNLVLQSENNFMHITSDRNEVKFLFESASTTNYYGFGERYLGIEQSGQLVDNFVYNQYKDQSLKTYIPMPLFMTDRGYGMFSDTLCYSSIDMTESDSRIQFILNDNNAGIYVYSGTLKEQLQHYYDVTGEAVMVPKWSMGPWMSSNNWDNQAEVMKQFNKTIEEDIPSTVLVIEAWSDEATYYLFNDARYDELEQDKPVRYEAMNFPKWGRWPDPKKMTEELHEQGTKLILWQIPIIKQISSLNHHQKDLDEAYAVNHGYVVRNEDGSPYRIAENWFMGSLIMDFSNSKGSQWWFDKRRYLIEDIGVDGFKTDGGECIFGQSLQFESGLTGKEMRNQYPNDYIQAYYDMINRHTEGITFSRAGYSGAHRMPTHWAGDENSTFPAFKRNLTAGLNAAMSGIVFWGWDMAGFSGKIPSAELYIRATQMAAFSPIMQYHAESKAEFNQDRTPWNIAERTGRQDVMDVYRYYAHLRMNLLPYIYSEFAKSCRDGLPMMRPMVLMYEEDINCKYIDDQYMFGESLLIAPIVEEGVAKRAVYLPKGQWRHLFTGEVYDGEKTVDIECQGIDFPVFADCSKLLPLDVHVSFLETLDKKWVLGKGKLKYRKQPEKLVFVAMGQSCGYEYLDDLLHHCEIVKIDGQFNVKQYGQKLDVELVDYDRISVL